MTARRPDGQAEQHDDLRAFRAADQRFGESGDFRAEFRYRLVRPTLVAGVDWRGARRGRFGCGSHAYRDAGRKAGLVDGVPGFYRAALLVRGSFAMRAWSRREIQRRSAQAMRALPVITGMIIGAVITAAAALGVGLFYLHTDQLEFHAFGLGRTTDTSAPYEAIFFQYLFPGLLLGQLAGGLIGRVIGHPLMPPAEHLSDTIALSA
jgi:hypothetical protein